MQHRTPSHRQQPVEPIGDEPVHVVPLGTFAMYVSQQVGGPCRMDRLHPGRLGARARRLSEHIRAYHELVHRMLDALQVKSVPACRLPERVVSIPDIRTDDEEEAYPTEARLRAKAREKAGHVAKKRIQHVEDHQDDLGDDLKGLGPNLE